MLETYRGLLRSHPLQTNMVTASILTVASDCISQSMERRIANASSTTTATRTVQHDFQRSTAMGIYGAFVFGAFVTWWFSILSRWVPVAAGDLKAVIKKVLVNQVLMSPGLNTVFFTWVVFTRKPFSTTLDQKLTTLREKLRTDLPATIARSCVYWTILNTINFGLVPTHMQVLFTNMSFLVWTVYLTFVGYRSVPVTSAKKQ
jgi:Mpv17 / PMP22 family